MPNRLVRLTVVATVGVAMAGAVTACSSSLSADRPRVTTSVASTSSTPAADPATELFGRLRAARSTVTSVHVIDQVDAYDVRDQSDLTFSAVGDLRLESGKVAAAHLKLDTGRQRGEVVFSGKRLYLKLDGRNGPGGKPWVTTEKTPDDYAALPVAFGYLVVPASPDFVAALKPGATDVRRRLPITEAGVETTPYAIRVDVAKVRNTLSILREFADRSGVLDATVSLDPQGRPAKLNVTGRSEMHDVFIDATFSRWNRTVDISAPPADQVGS